MTKRPRGFRGLLLLLGLTAAVSACSRRDEPSSSPPEAELGLRDGDEERQTRHLIPLRSLEEIERLLRVRLTSDPGFELLDLLVAEETPQIFDALFGVPTRDELRALLGARKGLGLRIATDSLRPSAMHSLLWSLLLDALATDVAQGCAAGGEGRIRLTGELRLLIGQLCAPQTPDRALLEALGRQLLRQDGSEAELARWVESEQESAAALDGAARVRHLVRSLLLGPEFLIGR